jgi:hypothetical protein
MPKSDILISESIIPPADWPSDCQRLELEERLQARTKVSHCFSSRVVKLYPSSWPSPPLAFDMLKGKCGPIT